MDLINKHYLNNLHSQQKSIALNNLLLFIVLISLPLNNLLLFIVLISLF